MEFFSPNVSRVKKRIVGGKKSESVENTPYTLIYYFLYYYTNLVLLTRVSENE